jgi:hypothetical protein
MINLSLILVFPYVKVSQAHISFVKIECIPAHNSMPLMVLGILLKALDNSSLSILDHLLMANPFKEFLFDFLKPVVE